MLSNPSATRNKAPILEVLKRFLKTDSGDQKLLEISSGVGEHAGHFAPAFPNITFQPSEFDKTLLGSITSYANRCPTDNIKPPMYIDITQDFHSWVADGGPSFIDHGQIDYMVNINMIHISPIDCTKGLFRNAGALLKSKGLLITYGPYAEDGVLTPDSNVSFNESLKHRNPEWGIKDIADLKKIALECGIAFLEKIDMPANNKCLIWQKN
jgi:hypothetical protein